MRSPDGIQFSSRSLSASNDSIFLDDRATVDSSSATSAREVAIRSSRWDACVRIDETLLGELPDLPTFDDRARAALTDLGWGALGPKYKTTARAVRSTPATMAGTICGNRDCVQFLRMQETTSRVPQW